MNNRHGAVLIYVLSVTALLAALAAAATFATRSTAERTAHLLRQAEARYMAYGPLIFARDILAADLRTNGTDGPGDIWFNYTEPKTFPIENGEIIFQLTDAAAQPDLNMLESGTPRISAYRQVLERYFSQNNLPTEMIPVLKDWIDYDDDPSTGGAESSIYLAKNPPYPAANTWLADKHELRLLEGYTPEKAARVMAKTSLIPSAVPVNINTAVPEYMQALFTQARTLPSALSKRKNTTYQALGDFLGDAASESIPFAVELGVESVAFEVSGAVTYYGTQQLFSGLITRRNGHTRFERLSLE